MSLVVETGAGLPNSNSYASIAEADTYFTDRNNATWLALSSTVKSASLISAADYMQTEYAWRGTKSVVTQALEWPRMYVTVGDIAYGAADLPDPIKRACIELAYRASQNKLLPDINPATTDGRFVTKLIEKVGPIDEETTYATRGQMAMPMLPQWTAINSLLRPFVKQTGGVYR